MLKLSERDRGPHLTVQVRVKLSERDRGPHLTVQVMLKLSERDRGPHLTVQVRVKLSERDRGPHLTVQVMLNGSSGASHGKLGLTMSTTLPAEAEMVTGSTLLGRTVSAGSTETFHTQHWLCSQNLPKRTESQVPLAQTAPETLRHIAGRGGRGEEKIDGYGEDTQEFIHKGWNQIKHWRWNPTGYICNSNQNNIYGDCLLPLHFHFIV